jgi:hypothetical protein
LPDNQDRLHSSTTCAEEKYVNVREQWRRWRHTELGADWRLQLARRHVESEKRRMPIDFDSATRSLAEYLQSKEQGDAFSAAADSRSPHIALAESAWAQPELRAAVQMLVLADVAVPEICEQLDLEADVLTTIEDLYFDVRSMLTASHWIVQRVIHREADAGRDDLAAKLRMSYFHGAYAAKALIEARTTLPMDAARQLADAAVLLHAKFLQAVEMPLAPEQTIEFLKLTAEIRREKLTFRMQRWTQRCEMNRARSEKNGDASNSANGKGSTAQDVMTAAEVN